MNRLYKAGVLTMFGAATCAVLAMPAALADPEPTPAPATETTVAAEPAEATVAAEPAEATVAAEPAEATVAAEPAEATGSSEATGTEAPAETTEPAAPLAAGEQECSAAGLSETISSVMDNTSAYLKEHPDVDQALLDATKQSAFFAIGAMDNFFAAHPVEAGEVRAIQQPARDYQARCGMVVEPAEAFVALQGV